MMGRLKRDWKIEGTKWMPEKPCGLRSSPAHDKICPTFRDGLTAELGF
jgi:hypothetical protein